MKFTYLGTAAAEGWPAVFCNCDFCNTARLSGGKDIRTRSQAMLEDDVLIDFPADTYHHALYNSINLSKIRYVFVTHTHSDHLLPYDLIFRGSCYAHKLISEKITFVGNEAMCSWMQKNIFENVEVEKGIAKNITTEYIPPYTPTKFGEYTLTALKAQHKADEVAYVYLIQKNYKAVLYLHDTGMLPDETFKYLADCGVKPDFVSYDCTYVLKDNASGHLGLPNCAQIRDRLLKEGVITENTINIINHFSHNCGVLHVDLVAEAEKYGFLVSFDGMEINL